MLKAELNSVKNHLIKLRTVTSFVPLALLIPLIPLLLPAAGGAYQEGDDADAILQNLLREDKYVSYEASEIVTVFAGGQQQLYIYKIGQQKPDKLRIEKRTLDGKVQEIMVHDDKLQIEYYPEENIVIKRRRVKKHESPKQFKEHLSLVRSNYDVKIAGNASISHRNCTLVDVTPKERGTRPRFRTCVDNEMSLPLKRETYSTNGDITYMSTFTDILFNPSFEKDYFVIMVPRFTTAYELEEPDTNSPQPDAPRSEDHPPYTVPGGYVLREIRKDGDDSFQLIYYDGLNRISAFMESGSRDKGMQGDESSRAKETNMERVNAEGFQGFFCDRGTEKIVSFTANDYKYTVVGEVSKEGLINISSEINKRSLKR